MLCQDRPTLLRVFGVWANQKHIAVWTMNFERMFRLVFLMLLDGGSHTDCITPHLQICAAAAESQHKVAEDTVTFRS